MTGYYFPLSSIIFKNLPNKPPSGLQATRLTETLGSLSKVAWIYARSFIFQKHDCLMEAWYRR